MFALEDGGGFLAQAQSSHSHAVCVYCHNIALPPVQASTVSTQQIQKTIEDLTGLAVKIDQSNNILKMISSLTFTLTGLFVPSLPK